MGNSPVNTPKDRLLERYIEEVTAFELLTREEEFRLAREYLAHGNQSATDRLLNSNLRFVVKVVQDYRGYDLPILDLIQEGNLGLMKAIQKFDPERGFRLVSYAVWWIRAYIQNYVIRSWSLVKIGTTQNQRKLFFKLRSERERLTVENENRMPPSSEELAEHLGVPLVTVELMEQRMAVRDYSFHRSSSEHAGIYPIDSLHKEDQDPEHLYGRQELNCAIRMRLDTLMQTLSDKEIYIISERLMAEDRKTLQHIGHKFGFSRERARQLEGRLIKKLRLALRCFEALPSSP
jgi:RNA polymerase sigma-32 factor